MFTTDPEQALRVADALDTGMVFVNGVGMDAPELPFGGTKDSSFGPKEQGPAALEFYSDYKTIYLKY